MFRCRIKKKAVLEKINEKKWFALYTKSRAEKKVELELAAKGFEVYLPLEKRLRIWSDRKKWVYEPLIRSYIFVKTSHGHLENAFYTPGVFSIVKFEGLPAPIPEKQINLIKVLLSSGESFEVTARQFEIGDKVTINKGDLKNCSGELIRHLNKYKVLVRLDIIQQNLLIHINPSYLKKVKQEV